MIRIRDRKGSIIEFEEENQPIIVEILDGNDDVSVVFIEVSDSHVKQINAQDYESEAYAKAFNVKFSGSILGITPHQ